jgi:hypothetical protein
MLAGVRMSGLFAFRRERGGFSPANKALVIAFREGAWGFSPTKNGLWKEGL